MPVEQTLLLLGLELLLLLRVVVVQELLHLEQLLVAQLLLVGGHELLLLLLRVVELLQMLRVHGLLRGELLLLRSLGVVRVGGAVVVTLLEAGRGVSLVVLVSIDVVVVGIDDLLVFAFTGLGFQMVENGEKYL